MKPVITLADVMQAAGATDASQIPAQLVNLYVPWRIVVCCIDLSHGIYSLLPAHPSLSKLVPITPFRALWQCLVFRVLLPTSQTRSHLSLTVQQLIKSHKN